MTHMHEEDCVVRGCGAPAVGEWLPALSTKRLCMCDAHRTEYAAMAHSGHVWEAFTPTRQVAERLRKMAAGAFG